MGQKIKTEKEFVKKDTMWMVASIALIVGFLGGVAFGVYKSGTNVPMQKTTMTQQVEKNQTVSVERAAQILEFEKITSENPEDATAWANLGNLYFDTGNHKKAIIAYQKSLELNPNNAQVIIDLGIMYRRTGQPKKAVAAFDKAIKIEPNHETALFNKGIVLLHDLNDMKGAIQAWEELVKMNPLAKSPSGEPIKDLVDKMKKSMKP